MTKRHEEPGIEALQVGPTVSGYLGDPSRFRVSVARTWIPLPLLPTPPPPVLCSQPQQMCCGGFADPRSEPHGWIAS